MFEGKGFTKDMLSKREYKDHRGRKEAKRGCSLSLKLQGDSRVDSTPGICAHRDMGTGLSYSSTNQSLLREPWCRVGGEHKFSGPIVS